MTQANSVPSSSRQLITGDSAKQSTNLRAVNLPAVAVRPANRHCLIGGSNTRTIIGSDEAPAPPAGAETRRLPACADAPVLPRETVRGLSGTLVTKQAFDNYSNSEITDFTARGSRNSAPRNDVVLASMLPESPFDAARAHRSRRS